MEQIWIDDTELDEDKILRLYMQPAVVVIAEKVESYLLDLYAGFKAEE